MQCKLNGHKWSQLYDMHLSLCSLFFSSFYIVLVLEALSLGEDFHFPFKSISAFDYLMLSPYPFPLLGEANELLKFS